MCAVANRDRLTGLDSSFLHLERDSAHMHVAGCMVFEGVADGRFAMLSKTHHALVDGISGVDIATVLFDASPDPMPVAPPEQQWVPRPMPSGAQLLADALLERATAPREIARGMRAALRGPRALARAAGQSLVGLGAMAWAGLRAAPASPFNVKIGPQRRFTWVRGDLAQFKEVKNTLGGTVNDVVLAAVTGALGRYMRMHGHPTEGVELRAMIPVSVRADIERGALGNRVAAMWAPLPVGVIDPVERLHAVSAAMNEVKHSGQAVGAEVLTALSGFAPPTIMSQAARLQARQRLFNLVVTNVPGPQHPLYVLGRELRTIYPMVPLAENTALGIAIMSYNGQLNFGLVVDYDAVPDVEVLAEELRSSIDELEAAAKLSGVPATGARGRGTAADRRLRALP